MSNYKIMPHSEIVFSVKHLEKNLPFYIEGLKMDVKHQGATDLNTFYQIEATSTAEVLVVRGQEKFGNIRLVQFEGVEQELIRPNGRIWDTGGIYDFDIRVIDIEKTMSELRNYDWRGHGETVVYSTGFLSVNEAFLRGPEDMVVALIERTQPPLANPDKIMGVSSNVFNSAMVVADYEKSKHFLTDILGFHVYHEDEVHWEKGPNILNLPYNLVEKGVCNMFLAQAQKDIPLMIEIVQFPYLEGTDFSAKAKPPNLGIMSYRFPVEGLQNFYRYIENQPVTICSPLQKIVQEPYGEVSAFAIESPDGVWMEFYE